MRWCELCDESCDGPIPICIACEQELPWLSASCVCCSLPLSEPGLHCGACLVRPPYFQQSLMPWRYAFPVDRLITAFKHQGRWPYGRLLADLLIEHLKHQYANGLAKPDLLIPTPLSAKRLRQRGFNQAQMLTHWLAKALAVPYREAVTRRKDTPAQQGLSARARRQNLKRAFSVEADLAGLHVALVDDVLTTGATANSIAQALMAANATRVDVYCLARTPAPGED